MVSPDLPTILRVKNRTHRRSQYSHNGAQQKQRSAVKLTPLLLLRYYKERDRHNAAQCVTQGGARFAYRFLYNKIVRIDAHDIATMGRSKAAQRCNTNVAAVVALRLRTQPTQHHTARHTGRYLSFLQC